MGLDGVIQCNNNMYSAGMLNILILLYRKMPIREFYLDRILTELELSHDEVSITSQLPHL